MLLHRFFALALVVFSLNALAQPVLVQGEEDGQGFLRQRENDCYLITPQHVLRQLRAAEFVGDRAVRYRAHLVRSYDPDLAILRVDADLECSGRFPDGGALDRLLLGSTRAHLLFRSASGAIRQTSVEIVASDERFIRIRPANDGERLFRGMSGSPLMIGGSTAGMLQSVDAGSGMGIVLRQDYMGNVLSAWFPSSQVQSRPYITGNVEPIVPTNDIGGLITEGYEDSLRARPVISGEITPSRPLPEVNTGNDDENRDKDS